MNTRLNIAVGTETVKLEALRQQKLEIHVEGKLLNDLTALLSLNVSSIYSESTSGKSMSNFSGTFQKGAWLS